MDLETVETVKGILIGGVMAVVIFYGGFRMAVHRLGQAIPGDDPVERFDRKLKERMDGIMEAIEKGVDLLNPKTHGGAGKDGK